MAFVLLPLLLCMAADVAVLAAMLCTTSSILQDAVFVQLSRSVRLAPVYALTDMVQTLAAIALAVMLVFCVPLMCTLCVWPVCRLACTLVRRMCSQRTLSKQPSHNHCAELDAATRTACSWQPRDWGWWMAAVVLKVVACAVLCCAVQTAC